MNVQIILIQLVMQQISLVMILLCNVVYRMVLLHTDKDYQVVIVLDVYKVLHLMLLNKHAMIKVIVYVQQMR